MLVRVISRTKTAAVRSRFHHLETRFVTSSSKFEGKLTFSSPTLCEDLKKAISLNHPNRNVTQSVLDKVGKNLHKRVDHPLGIIKSKYVIFTLV
jgi:hypothetical protein